VEAIEVAVLMGVAVKTLRNWRSAEVGPRWTKFGRQVLYPVAGIEGYLEGNVNATWKKERTMGVSVQNRRSRAVSKLTDLEDTDQNRKKAERLERERRDSILKGLEPARKPKAVLFSVAGEEFLKHCRVQHKDRPNTAKRVKTSMASLLEMFRNRPVASIGEPDVERHKTWRLDDCGEIKAVRTVTLRHDLDNFSKFLGWSIKMGYATSNPVRGVEKPSIEDAVRMYILSDAEEFTYFELALARSIDLHDVATLIINQGMRPEEVIEIEKKNVGLIARTVRIRARTIEESVRFLCP
jgi:hypothetical protein